MVGKVNGTYCKCTQQNLVARPLNFTALFMLLLNVECFYWMLQTCPVFSGLFPCISKQSWNRLRICCLNEIYKLYIWYCCIGIAILIDNVHFLAFFLPVNQWIVSGCNTKDDNGHTYVDVCIAWRLTSIPKHTQIRVLQGVPYSLRDHISNSSWLGKDYGTWYKQDQFKINELMSIVHTYMKPRLVQLKEDSASGTPPPAPPCIPA